MSVFRTDKARIEVIHWVDSNMTSRWDSKETYLSYSENSMECRSVGFVVHESKDRVSILQSESAMSFADMVTIPKSAILKRVAMVPSARSKK